MSKGPSLTITTDKTSDFEKIISKFKRDAILVGIPEVETTRKTNPLADEKETITNASLLAIAQFGSPINNIPARPVMTIGLRNAQSEIVDQLRQGAKLAMTQGFSAIDVYYNRAGLIAANSIKKAINSQEGFEGPSDATLAARKAAGFKGTKALIVTGQMRNAITYVIRGKE